MSLNLAWVLARQEINGDWILQARDSLHAPEYIPLGWVTGAVN